MALTRIMVVDRDEDAVDQIKAISDDLGLVQIVFEPIRNRAIEQIREEKFHAAFFDPAPNPEELRSFIIGVRRENKSYVPVTVMSRHLQSHEAMACGANDFLSKPLDIEEFRAKIKNIRNLSELVARLGDDHKDSASRDGVISKTAFFQIFMSSLDRADRYGEETYLLFVRIDNIHDLEMMYGDETAEDLCDKLKKYTVRIRRISDIVGRTAANEFCVMIVRPMNHSEPLMAVNRFADSIREDAHMFMVGEAQAHVSVHLMALPNGRVMFSEECY